MFNKSKNKKKEDLKPIEKESNISVVKEDKNIGEIAAAISISLHLYITETHDFERTILTIQKVMRPYSPWSSKIYGLREMPNKYPGNRFVYPKKTK